MYQNSVVLITADHGELLGENGLYGHPADSDAEKLRKVPWYSLEG
jgi:glucan phosphoethanolaminetransferase (alkaline phosphatase superfamily)